MPFVSPFNNNIFFAAEHADFSRMYGRKITRRNGFTPRILKSKTIGSISRMFSPILANVRDKFEKIAWRDDRAPISCKTIITHFHDPEQFPVERSIFPDDKTPLSRIRISRLRNKGNRKALGHRSISFAVIKTFDDITKKDTKIDRELRYSLSSPSEKEFSFHQFYSRVYTSLLKDRLTDFLRNDHRSWAISLSFFFA